MKLFFNTIAKSTMLLFALVLLSGAVLAQRTITGTVTDADTKEPLIGASILVTGTLKGTLTDVDGNYSLTLPADAKMLTITYTGYAAQNIEIGSGNVINVEMNAGTLLDQVVVVGYGELKQREVTSAVATVKAENFNQGNITDPAQLLQGKVAGLTISKPGGDPNGNFEIRLRGLASLGNTAPLTVVDGVAGVPYASIDPNDIAAMDVLKDGSAAAIYGTRASAGVVIITTKKGQAGKSTVEYNGQLSTESIAQQHPVLNTADYLAAGGTNWNSSTDWISEITRNATSMSHSLAFGGGAKGFSYRVSGNIRDFEGVVKNTDFRQLNGRINVSQTALDDKLRLEVDVTATNRGANFVPGEAVRYAYLYNPSAPVLDAANVANGGYFEQAVFDNYNPVAIISQNNNQGRQQLIVANLSARYQLAKGLGLKVAYAPQLYNNSFRQYNLKQSYFGGQGTNGFASNSDNNDYRQQFQTLLDYSRDINRTTSLSFLGGYEYNDQIVEGNRMSGGDFLTNATTFNSMQSSNQFPAGLGSVSSFKVGSKLIAFFGRVSMSFNETYSITASLRREGSTMFGVNNKWGNFPGISAGVNLDKFLKNDNVNQLKLRVGYGETGSLPPSPYLSQLLYSPGAFFFYNGKFVPSYGPTRNANPNLRWETKGETNVGLDFALMDYRLTGSVDWYTRSTTDLIYPFAVPQPPNFAGTTWANVGDLRNTGLELLLNYSIVKSDNFKWDATFNYSTVATKLVSLSDSTSGLSLGSGGIIYGGNVGSPGLNNTTQTRVAEGEPLGQIWGPVVESINEAGQFVYKDLDGDGTIESNGDDRQLLGNGIPRHTLGLLNSFKFGQFDFNFFLRGVMGHSIINQYRLFYEVNNEGTIKSYNQIRTELYDPNIKNADFNDLYVEKADFLRLDNAALGYTFKLPEGSNFSRVRVFVTTNNLFTLTNYTGADPEARLRDTESNDILAIGIDRRNTYFTTRSFSVGLNVGF